MPIEDFMLKFFNSVVPGIQCSAVSVWPQDSAMLFFDNSQFCGIKEICNVNSCLRSFSHIRSTVNHHKTRLLESASLFVSSKVKTFHKLPFYDLWYQMQTKCSFFWEKESIMFIISHLSFYKLLLTEKTGCFVHRFLLYVTCCNVSISDCISTDL